MSTKGIYSAVSGAIAQTQRLDTIANNLANVNTPGFKRDGQVFREYLTAYEKLPEVIQAPRVPASVESFYDMQSADRSYVDNVGTFTDHSQGALKQTGNTMDFALEGKSYFEVLTPQGVRWTRVGNFAIDAQGQIVTKQGFPVLGRGNPGLPPDQRIVKTDRAGGNITVSPLGEIFQGPQRIGQFSLVETANPDALQKTGMTLYSIRENYNPQFVNTPDPKVHQGFLETSNVNVVKEMTDMISTTRTFETLQKAIQAYDQMNDKLVNTIPKF